MVRYEVIMLIDTTGGIERKRGIKTTMNSIYQLQSSTAIVDFKLPRWVVIHTFSVWILASFLFHSNGVKIKCRVFCVFFEVFHVFQFAVRTMKIGQSLCFSLEWYIKSILSLFHSMVYIYLLKEKCIFLFMSAYFFSQ